MINISGLGPAMDCYIMNSDLAADKVISLFEDAIRKGYHPEEVEQEIYRQANVNPADFTEFDKQKITRRVSEIYQSKENHS